MENKRCDNKHDGQYYRYDYAGDNSYIKEKSSCDNTCYNQKDYDFLYRVYKPKKLVV